jgi:VacB/RNase II family 3'-5' exoribonuclease
MVSHRVAGAPLDFAAVRAELAVPGDFTSAVLDEAADAARRPLPSRRDATDIPFVTVDPAGSKDLDQAAHLARTDDGYLVSYAIADVAAFVTPGGQLDDEAQRRGETLYFPDARVTLYPAVLSEGAASLLPDQVRPAVLWQIALDDEGNARHVDVQRALVRSRAQLDYVTVQRQLDEGTLPDALTQLGEIGRKRLQLARSRHAINLDLPEQDVDTNDGSVRLVVRKPLPVEQFNAELSLLTGMAAARIMLAHEIGILRTLPEPDAHAVASLRRAALALGVNWPEHAHAGDVLAALDHGNPHDVALLEHATTLLRGAGYTAFAGAQPSARMHAGIGAPYAHVTAPLRRLVDRYATEICVAVQSGEPVPDWVRERMTTLPDVMQAADHRAHEIDRAVVDATEAWLLRDRVGERFHAVVLDPDEHAATVMLDDPPVRARCTGEKLQAGDRITVQLTQADVATRTVKFQSE